MAGLVVVLGAGASADDGCPCMNDFFDKAALLHARGELADLASEYDTVCQVRNKLSRAFVKSNVPIHNLEWILGAIEMNQLLSDTDVIPGVSYKEARRSLIRLIGGVLEGTQQFIIGRSGDHRGIILEGPPAYNRLVDMCLRLKGAKVFSDISFVTLNYDLGLEIALHSRQKQVNYHLTPTPGTNPNVIDVFKLHGSLNWYEESDARRKILRSVPLEYIAAQVMGGISTTKAIKLKLSDIYTQHGRIGMSLSDAFIVPPTDAKHDLRSKMREIWSSAAAKLAEAEAIVFVGYSLPPTDSFFHVFYSLATISDTILRHFVVCDKSDKAARRYQRAVGGMASQAFKFVNSPFKDGLPDIEKLLTPRE